MVSVRQVLLIPKQKGLKMGNYINVDRISAETHAQFDAFAAGVMTDTMRELNTPTQELNLGMDEKCQRILNQWADKGLVNARPGQSWSVMDVAMATVLTVLKKRGLSMNALRQIWDGLNQPMYEDMSVLGFAVLLCRQEYHHGQSPHNAPYLVIDGENRITLCRVADMPLVLTQPEILTYSHLVLNMGSILHKCNFIHKIQLSHEAEFSELPAQIAMRLLDSNTKRFSIDREHGRIKTVSNGGTAPQYGERLIKYAAGRVVSDTVTTVEPLNE